MYLRNSIKRNTTLSYNLCFGYRTSNFIRTSQRQSPFVKNSGEENVITE